MTKVNVPRLQAAVQTVRPVVERALRGEPLPKYTDPGFEDYARAVARITHADDFKWLGKAVAIVLGEHAAAQLKAARETQDAK